MKTSIRMRLTTSKHQPLTASVKKSSNFFSPLRLALLVGAVYFAALTPWEQSAAWGQNAANVTNEKEKPQERLIYLPYKNLKTVLEKPDGSVLVPYADYIKLWEKAFGDGPQKPDQVPIGGLITTASYVAKVEKDVALISATFTAQVLEKGWVEIPVKFGEAAIGKVTSDSGKVLVRGMGNGSYTLMLPTVGEQKVSLELMARVRSNPEGKSLDLDVPPVGITTFELSIPEADQSIELKPKLVTQPVEVAAKESRIKASVGATEKLSVRWHPRVGTKPEMELLASVTNQTVVTVEDGLIHTDASLMYEILRGQFEKATLVVPKGHRILDITSEAKVKDWKSVEERERQVVTVEMLGRVDGKVTLEVHTECAIPTDAFDVAGLEGETAYGVHALNVIRENGVIAVKSGSDLTLTVEEQRGLQRVDEAEIAAKLKRPGALYYKYYSPAFRLKILAKPIQARLIVDHQSQVVFRDDQIRLRSTLNYAIDRAGVFELKFTLPEDISVENVVCDRMKQFDVSSDKKTLTVSLREKTQGNVSVTAFSTRSLDPSSENTDQKLPLIEPLGIEIENGKVQVYAPDAIDVITDAEKAIGVQPDPAPQTEAVANARLVSSWIYNRRPVEIPVRSVRKPTRLTAIVGTKADVKQGQVQVITNLSYLIEHAGIDTFRFAVPEIVADKVQINSKAAASGPLIKQKSRELVAVDGWVTWTVVMQREVLGTQTFEVIYDLVPVKGTEANRETTTIEAVRVLDPYSKTEGPLGKRDITVSRTIGEVTVVKDRALSVSAIPEGGDIEPIDVRELQHLSQDGFVAFRYFKQPAKVELTSNKYDVQGVVETVVGKALIEMVLDRTGVATNRCRYVIRSSERQRLRVDLPENVEIIGVLVDRKVTALEKADAPAESKWASYYVNVARTKPSDEPFTLTILFRHSHQPAPFQSAGGSLQARLPLIGGGAKSAVAVQQMHVKIWVPPEYSLVGTPKNYSVQTQTRLRKILLGRDSRAFGEQDLENWIGQGSGGVFDFPTEGHWFQYMNLGGSKLIEVAWWNLPFYTWVVSGALVVIALILRNTTCDNKLTLVIIALFAACAYALKDLDWIIQGLQVASYGLIAAVAIWIVHGLFCHKPNSVGSQTFVPAPEPPPQAGPPPTTGT